MPIPFPFYCQILNSSLGVGSLNVGLIGKAVILLCDVKTK
jgi:hypothetical protein